MADIFHLNSSFSPVRRTLFNLKKAIDRDLIWRPTSDVSFIFLCGANRENGGVSRRREAIVNFAKARLPHTRVFLAEDIFSVITGEGHNSNVLDVESDISRFADYIIIILESESAFCELGAFSVSTELRNRIIVINNVKYKDSESFISMGPLSAIMEKTDNKNVIYYKMEEGGQENVDRIADTFRALYTLVPMERIQKRRRAKDVDPAKYNTKDSIRLIHDLIYLTSPIKFEELYELLGFLFPKRSRKKLISQIGLLSSIREVVKNEAGFWRSTLDKPYLEYTFVDMHDVLSTFKSTYLKYDPIRML